MPDQPPRPDCLLWKLPLEVREEIYYYALLQPPEHNTPGDWVRIATAGSTTHDTWWRTEQMTRILRVNRQVHDEAEAVLYSRFKFRFPQYTDTKLVHALLDPISARARSHLRSIGICVILRCRIPPGGGYADPVSKRNEAKCKETFSLLVELLPGLREVALEIAFVGFQVPEEEGRHVVELALRIASPLRNVEKLRLSPVDAFHDQIGSQRLEIWRDVVQRVHDGVW